MRKQAQTAAASSPIAAKQNSEGVADVDYLDIPAFLRRQEEA